MNFKKCFKFFQRPFAKTNFPDNTECCVCLDLMDKIDWTDEKIVQLLPCGHFFHHTCIYDWMCERIASQKCPLCTQSIKKFCINCDSIYNVRHLKTEIEKTVLLQKCNKSTVKLVVCVDQYSVKIFAENYCIKKQIISYLQSCKLQQVDIHLALRQIVTSPMSMNHFYFFRNIHGYFYFTNIK